MNKKVVVGMSGGVDSAVAAYLLKEQGYDVIGVTMQIWQDEELDALENNGGCCGASAVDDARRVSETLDIPYYVLNFKRDFKQYVIDYFIEEYQRGRTPNPCIACNRYVKWESLLHKALELGADYIATGHYARVVSHPQTRRYALQTSVTAEKDQTYALYNLTQFQLAHTLMPVGDFYKDETRKIAAQIGLQIASKPDSQEICFVPDQDYGKFIEQTTGLSGKPGDFVDEAGNILGKHKGIIHYTIGQRKGLGLAMGRRIFVKEIDVTQNRVVLGDDSALFTRLVIAQDVNCMSVESLDAPRHVTAKIRYNHKPAPCTAVVKDAKLHLEFDEPQRAVTPGQAVVVYEDDYVLCGGVIER